MLRSNVFSRVCSRVHRWTLIAGLAWASTTAPAGGEEAASARAFRAGFAERDITPSAGMEMPGGYGKAFLGPVHDPCKVRAAVFDDGSRLVALVGVDALMVPRKLVLAARAAIEKDCGIPPHAVLIGASHSHSSGPVGMVQPGEYDDASPFVRDLAYTKSSAADAAYLARVEVEVVAAVKEAFERRIDAACGAGTGTESLAGFNRRFHMRNGLVFTHPGKGNPDILEPAGPIDPAVGVVGAWSREGRLLGCVVNFACHATTNPGGISANWIHYLESTIRGAFGPEVVVVFLQGFSGDVTQVDNRSPYDERPGEDGARYVGARVGAEAVKVLVTMARGGLAPLGARASVAIYPRRRPSPETLARALETCRGDPAAVEHTEWTFAKETVLLDALLRREPECEVELQAVQVGPAVFLAAPGEMFCALGLELREKSRFPFTFPVELAGGCVGYVPTVEALEAKGGGYETRLTSYTNLQPSAGPDMVRGLLGLLDLEAPSRLVPGTPPVRPPAPPFSGPWTYGNVPPGRE
jgi:hypothetical protein